MERNGKRRWCSKTRKPASHHKLAPHLLDNDDYFLPLLDYRVGLPFYFQDMTGIFSGYDRQGLC